MHSIVVNFLFYIFFDLFKKLKFEYFIEIFERIIKKKIEIISKVEVKYTNSENFAHKI